MSLEDKLARSIVFNYTFLLSQLQFWSATAPGVGKAASSGARGDRFTIQSTTTDINPKFSLLPSNQLYARFLYLSTNPQSFYPGFFLHVIHETGLSFAQLRRLNGLDIDFSF